MLETNLSHWASRLALRTGGKELPGDLRTEISSRDVPACSYFDAVRHAWNELEERHEEGLRVPFQIYRVVLASLSAEVALVFLAWQDGPVGWICQLPNCYLPTNAPHIVH